MKHVKSLIAASVLALSLSVTALAGDMQGPGIAQPGDMGGPGVVQPGETHGPGIAQPCDTEPGVTQGPCFAPTESGSDTITDTAISMIKLFASIL